MKQLCGAGFWLPISRAKLRRSCARVTDTHTNYDYECVLLLRQGGRGWEAAAGAAIDYGHTDGKICIELYMRISMPEWRDLELNLNWFYGGSIRQCNRPSMTKNLRNTSDYSNAICVLSTSPKNKQHGYCLTSSSSTLTSLTALVSLTALQK